MLNQDQKKFVSAINAYLQHKQDSVHEDISILQNIEMDSFTHSTYVLMKEFGTSFKTGLAEGQVQRNIEIYGENQFKKKKTKTLCQIFYDSITDEMLIILMIASVISIIVEFFFGEDKSKFWVEGVSILVAVAICSFVATLNDYQKNRQFQQLDKLADQTFNYEVIRNGQRVEIHRSEVVVGDIIILNSGMEIPADSILIEGVDVIMDESQLTGQSQQVYKNTLNKCIKYKQSPQCPSPIMISGSTVSSGEGKVMVVIIGENSQLGKFYELIFEKDQDDQETKTPLEQRLQQLGTQIGYFGLYGAIGIFTILILRLVIENATGDGFNFSRDIGQVISYLILSIVIIVVAVPEGLPLAVTLTLAYSMKEMYVDQILVRKLISCQTMGGAHFICTDKTGTITQNKMFVVEFYNSMTENVRENNKLQFHPEYAKILSNAIFHNSSSHLDPEKGSQTEIALIKFARNCFGKTQFEVRKNAEPDGYFKRLPFNSNRKRMTTGLTQNSKNYLFSNGASQAILKSCQFYQDAKTNQTSAIKKGQYEQAIKNMAEKGLRVVGVSYKIVKSTENSETMIRSVGEIEEVEKKGYTLLALFGIEDKPRPQSRDAIKQCRDAGVNVIMVTGDNIDTAKAIGKQVEIINDENQKFIEGKQFEKMLSEKGMLLEQMEGKQQFKKKVKKVKLDSHQKIQDFRNIVSGLSVMARSKPQHKYLLVDGLIQLDNVVGVTGDGTNDAPALVKADIGLAMGETGTQVAKNASDIIILDDRFDSIVRALVWGRNIYLSIRKFLQFQLTITCVAVVMSLVSSALIRQSVLTTIQMLWINLIMDSLASLALSTEPPNQEELLAQKPNSRDEPLLTPQIIKHILGQTIFQVIILMILLLLGPRFLPQQKDAFDSVIGSDYGAKYYNGLTQGTMADGRFYTLSGDDAYKVFYDKYHVNSRHFTFIFNTFVFLQIFNFFCCRRVNDQLDILKGICKSWLFWFIVVIIVVFQVVIIEHIGQFFNIYPYGGLNMIQWFISIGIGFLVIPMSMLIRLIPIGKKKKQEEGWKQ